MAMLDNNHGYIQQFRQLKDHFFFIHIKMYDNKYKQIKYKKK